MARPFVPPTWLAAARAFQALVACCFALSIAPPPAAAQDAINLALLIDTSGSIRPADRATRNQLAADIASQLGAGSEIAVFTFDDQPKLILPRTRDAAKVAEAVSQLGSAGRFTALNDALFDAARYLSEGPTGKRAIVIVTDGLDENSALVPEDGINEARERRIAIFAAGVGNVQERYLRRIAKLSGGEYFPPRSPAASIAGRVAELTPVSQPRAAAPQPAAATAATTAAPQPAAGAAAAARPATAPPPAAPTWPILAGVALAVLMALAALGFVLLRRPEPAPVSLRAAAPVPVAAAAAAPVVEEDVEDITLVGRREGLESEEHTLVLTMRPLLHVTRGPSSGKFFEVRPDSATSIGRAKGNEIVLDDMAVSSQHCRIRPRNGVYELIDLKSTNGTFLNERKVARGQLTAGDVIRIGESALQFRLDHTKGPTPPKEARSAEATTA